MEGLKHQKCRGIIAFLLSMAMLLGMAPTCAALDAGTETGAGGYTDELQTAVKYLDADRTEAEITLTMEATPHAPVNLILLVDASDGNQPARLDVQQALSNWLYSWIYDYGTAHPMKIITYGEAAAATDFMTDIASASDAVIQPASGTADEVVALQAAKAAVEAAQSDYPGNRTVVVWVPGADLNKTDGEIEPLLESLKGAFGADDALITLQKKGEEPSKLLKDYATQYTPAGETDAVPAAYACTSGASDNLFARVFRDTVEQVVHDHYKNISIPLRLSEAQSMVTGIKAVSCVTNSPRGTVKAEKTADGKGVDLTIGRLCREAGFTLTIEVTLDAAIQQKQAVFDAKGFSGNDLGIQGGLYTGVFDEQLAHDELTIQIPVIELNRAEHTITYALGAGAEGSTPAPVTAAAGTKVTIADSTGITKPGNTFGGWVARVGGKTLRYQPGMAAIMPESDITLTPAWGHVGISLEVGVTEASKVGNTMRDNLGLVGGLDFSNVMIDGKAVGTNVRSITFQDREISGATMDDPQGNDPLRATLPNEPLALYARFIGEGDLTEHPVFAYLVESTDKAGQYDMIIAGPGGVTAPAHIPALFAAVSKGQPVQGWQSGLEEIAFNGNFHTQYAEDLQFLFYYCEKLTSISGLDGLDLTKATTLKGMFRDNKALSEIDLSAWDTSQVQDMSFLLADCPNLTKVDLTWDKEDTKNFTTIRNFFSRDTRLETITGVEAWVLPNVTELTSVFYLCESLKTINLSAWKPEKATDASHLLRQCTNLEQITIEDWNMPNLQMLGYAFAGLKKVETIDLSTWTNLNSFHDFHGTFMDCSELKHVQTPGFCKGNYGSMAFYMTFDKTPKLETWDISGWEIETNKHGNYDSLDEIAVWGNDNNSRPAGVRIKADNWTLEGDATAAGVKGPWLCKNKQDLVSANNWDLNDIPQSLNGLFKKLLGTNSPTPLSSWQDFSGWTGLAGVTDMSEMFASASNLKNVSITNADLPMLTTAADMFSGATSLATIDFTGWSSVTGRPVLKNIFRGAKSPVTLTVSGDEIGGWLQAELSSGGQGASAAASAANGRVLPQSSEEKPGLPHALTNTGSRPQVDEEMYLLPAENGAWSGNIQNGLRREPSDAINIYGESTPAGTELTLRATVKYEGDLGARSGRIDLSIPLPESMELAAEPEISRSGFQYTGEPTGFIGGSVLKDPGVNNEGGMGASFSDMYSGTEIEVGFKVKLKDTVLVDGCKQWDIAGRTTGDGGGAAAASKTLRFWWKQEGGGSGGGGGGGSPADRYPVQVKVTGAGKAASNKEKASSGESVIIDTSGTVEQITAVADRTGKDVKLTENSDGKYLFQMPASAVTVTVQFKEGLGAADPDATGVADWLITKEHIRYLNGYGNGAFEPTRAMTRAEAAQMFYNLLLDKEAPEAVRFSDVPETVWYGTAVNTLASLGIVNGVGGNAFAPNRPITRAEFMVIAMRFAKQETAGSNIFRDVSETAWYYDSVVGSTRYGWINGYPDGTFRPNEMITRAEVTAVVNRMLGRSADKRYVDQHAAELSRFTDVAKSFWGYYDIMEAVNAHDHEKKGREEYWR